MFNVVICVIRFKSWIWPCIFYLSPLFFISLSSLFVFAFFWINWIILYDFILPSLLPFFIVAVVLWDLWCISFTYYRLHCADILSLPLQFEIYSRILRPLPSPDFILFWSRVLLLQTPCYIAIIDFYLAARQSSSWLYFCLLGRLRLEDHLSSRNQEQPGQSSETPSQKFFFLLKQ